MDWTVNDGIYHRFLKWHLNVKIFLNVNLQCFLREENAKKVIAWIGDFDMDQYVSWSLSTEELTLDTNLEKV